MKLHKDLVREILLEVEGCEDAVGQGWLVMELDGYTDLQISYHVQLLHEAGLLVGVDESSFDGLKWSAQRLTFEGHEYLDTIRDAEVWRKTKETASSVGASGVKMLGEIAVSYVKQKLAEKGLHLP